MGSRASKDPAATTTRQGPRPCSYDPESGDVLQLGGAREGKAAEAFNALARALAILSFLPDGVKFSGVHIKNVHPDEERR